MRKIAHWLEAHTEAESLDILCDLACEAALLSRHPLGGELERLIRKGEFLKVCQFVIPLDGSVPAEPLRYLRQAQAFFTKLDFLDLGIDRAKVAVEAFMDAEERCRVTNKLWSCWHDGVVGFAPDLSAVFHMAQGHVQRILGPRPSLDELRFRFGPGATSLTKKRESSIKRKLGKGVSCSDDLVGWARALLSEMPHLAELHALKSYVSDQGWWGVVPVVIHTGAISFVLKNYKTYRTTETQPTLNGMLQLAIGDCMFDRACRVEGLNLRDQTLNQRLARIGSLTGAVATLDLKSASNLNAVRPVQSLLPEDWFSLLKAARAGTTKVPGVGEVKLEMFSGMGNGYTFPLQSIIFWSIARSCATYLRVDKPIVSVYGDDIIVDTCVVPLLKRALECFGHIVNEEKSFVDGPFRESCGADFLQGTDVRPVYVKEILTPAVLFALHNGLRRKGYSDLADRVRTFVHPDLVLEGPDGYGDGHLVSESWRESRTVRRPNRALGYEGTTFATFTRRAKKDWSYHKGDRILHTYASYSRGAERLLPERVTDLGLAVKRSWGWCRFERAWMTGHGVVEEPSVELPFGNEEDSFDTAWEQCVGDDGLFWQGQTKACAFPGIDGYKKIAVYTLE